MSNEEIEAMGKGSEDDKPLTQEQIEAAKEAEDGRA